MALIKCVECGKEISDKSERCIHCGCPITHSLENNNQSVSSSEDNNNQVISPPSSLDEEQKRLFDLYVSAKSTCPNCGAQFKPGSKFCAKCGTPKPSDNQSQNQNGTSAAVHKWRCSKCGNMISEEPCSYCGAAQITENTYVPTKRAPQPRCMALGIIGLLFAFIGFFVLPIVFNGLGLIFAIITCASNPKEYKEGFKPIWKYDNKARGVGIAALGCNIIGIIFMIFNMVYYSTLFSGMF